MSSISIIIPVYNEEKTILKILERIDKIKIKSKVEIIIINDGSTDNSKNIIEQNFQYYQKVKHFDQNSGKGKAVIEGLKISTCDYIFLQDADLEYDPNDLIHFINIVEKNKADLIMGSRFIADKRSVLHFWHMLGNRIITFVFNVLNNTTFTDIYCCYCFFKKKILPISELRSFGWGQQAEILTYLSNKAIKIFEISVNYEARKYLDGKKIKYYHIFEIIYWIVYTKLRIFFRSGSLLVVNKIIVSNFLFIVTLIAA